MKFFTIMKTLSALVLGLVILGGCVSNSNLGTKKEVISAEETPIVFTHHDFTGGPKKHFVKPGSDTSGIYTSSYSSFEGGKAQAFFYHYTLIGIGYYVPKMSIERRFKRWNIEGAVKAGPKSFMQTSLGRLDLLPYKRAGENCVFLAKSIHEKGYFAGKICYDQPEPISAEKIASLGKSIYLK